MSFGQYYPSGRNNTNPIKSLTSGSNSNQSLSLDFAFEYKNPHASYYSLNYTLVESGGQNYPYTSTPTIPQPEHPDGSQAIASFVYGLTSQSLVMTNGGLDHEAGDTYLIYNTNKNNEPAVIFIHEVDDNGTIVGYSLINSGSGFNNNGIYIDQNAVGSNEQATFSFVADKFTIVNVSITDGGSGYDYFDEYGIVKNRKIIASNSGSGFGLIAYITTEPEFIGNEYKFVPKTHTSLPDTDIVISNYSMQNSSSFSSLSLNSYVITPCDPYDPDQYLNIKYLLLNADLSIDINKHYNITTFDEYGVYDPSLCCKFEIYDPEAFYEYVTITNVVINEQYNNCNACLNPPTSTPTPTPTPIPYDLSSSSSSIEQCFDTTSSDANTPYAKYTVAAVISGVTGYLSYREMYKFLNSYLPQEDSLPPIQADPDKILIGKLQRDIRTTFRAIMFGDRPIPQPPRIPGTTQIFYLEPIHPYVGIRLYEPTALTLPFKNITFAPLDALVDPKNNPDITTFKFSIPPEADNIIRNTFTEDTQGRPLYIPEDRPDLEDQVEKLTKNIQKHNKSNSMGIINRKSGTQFMQQNGIKSFKDFRTFHINKLIERWKTDPDFLSYIQRNPQLRDDIYEFIKLCIDKEIKLALSYKGQILDNWLMKDFGGAFQVNGGDYYYRTLVYRQNLSRMRHTLAPWYYDNVTKAFENEIIKQLNLGAKLPPKPTLLQRAISRVKSIKVPKLNLLGCKGKLSGAKIAGKTLKGLAYLQLILSAKGAADAYDDSATTMDGITLATNVLIDSLAIDIGKANSLDKQLPRVHGKITPEYIGSDMWEYDDQGQIIKSKFDLRYNPYALTKNSAQSYINKLLVPYLNNLYYKYYVGEASKEETLGAIAVAIDNDVLFYTYANLNLNDYNHPDNFLPPKNGHDYWPYIQSDAVEIKQVFTDILDADLLDQLADQAVDEASNTLGAMSGIRTFDTIMRFGFTDIKYRAIDKRKQTLKTLRLREQQLNAALSPLVDAAQDYFDSLPQPTGDNENNCDYLCYPQTFDNISDDPRVNGQVLGNEPLTWLILTPSKNEETGQYLATPQQIQQALDEFENQYYSK
jgi:hypothetical protein